MLEGIRLHGDAFARAGDVLQTGPTDGQRRRVVGRTAHLVDIPVGLQVTQVADTGIGTHAFRFLVIPQREGVVVTVGEDHRIALGVHGVQVVLSEVTAGVASAAVVVVPRLSFQSVYDGGYAHTYPNGEGIERTGVSIIAFTRLQWCLVEVDHNGQTGHEEQEEDDPELAYAFLVLISLPEESDETQQQG